MSILKKLLNPILTAPTTVPTILPKNNADITKAAKNIHRIYKSKDKKQAIKEELVKKYFGNQISTSDPKDEDISINGLEKVLKTILPFVKK